MCCFHLNSNYSLKDFLEPGATNLVPAATVGHRSGFHLQLTGSALFQFTQLVCRLCVQKSAVPFHQFTVK